ncbi:hypothetical protein [Candidatus Magnetaquicoccus inordinatus]|uniref:5'-methylthioadenosine/S-adenosylhomocysteine nucleosidase family protein n=1 Tax=Candidatus Magnetaquicoccus inordinatus TaxID=2496818 RepID=UPI00102C4A46|nr:hypothetical protein [Candidatus Magnetaquicoccus inordinatus]
MVYGIVPVEFGAAAPSTLSVAAPQGQTSFYPWLAGQWIGSSAQTPLALHSHQNPLTTLHLAISETQEASVNVRFTAFIHPWISEVTHIILDMGFPGTISVRPKIKRALAELMTACLDQDPALHCLILDTVEPETASDLSKLLISSPHKDRISFIAADGWTANLHFSLDRYQYRSLRFQLQGDPVQRLQQKMIRRLGHFERHDGQCSRFFLDGHTCVPEVAHLIQEAIRPHGELQYRSFPCLILFDADPSPWLPEALRMVQLNLTLAEPAQDIQTFLSRNLTAFEIANWKEPPLLICSMVATGKKLQANLGNWMVKCPIMPRVLTVVQAEEFRPDSIDASGRAVIDVGENAVTIHHLMKERLGLRPSATCGHLTEGTHKADEPEPGLLSESLTTAQFWDMVTEVGWRSEPDQETPGTRAKLKSVPNFPAMLGRHGAWLSVKLWQQLREINPKIDDVPVLLVCPDEEGAKKLAENLDLTFATALVVAIDTNTMVSLRNPNADILTLLRNWQMETSKLPWLETLETADRECLVVILEEFHCGGTTRKVLQTLLEHLRRKVEAHCTLVDFNPTTNGEAHTIPTVSLYAMRCPGCCANHEGPISNRDPAPIVSQVNIILNAAKEETNWQGHDLLLADFLTKLQGESPFLPETKTNLANKALDIFLLGDMNTMMRQLFGAVLSSPQIAEPRKTNVDLLVVAAIPAEHEAIMIALASTPNSIPIYSVGEYRIQRLEYTLEADQEPITIMVCWGKMKGNVDMAIATRSLLEQVTPNHCFMVGMAGGYEKTFSLGSVAISEKVIYYEPARMEGEGEGKPRYPQLTPNIYSSRLNYFSPDRQAIARAVEERLKVDSASKRQEILDYYQNGDKFRINSCTFMTGEKLFAMDDARPWWAKIIPGIRRKNDIIDPFSRWQETVDERANAVEMESFGFARACESASVSWLVFKGIADFGTAASKGRGGDNGERKKWQQPATMAATFTMLEFLRHIRKDEQVKEL